MPSGITPPTHDIVRRKFEKTRRNEGDFIPYRIRQIAQEINDFGTGTGRFINPTTGATINEEDINQNNTNNSSGSGSSGVEVMQEFVNEEVVDFEEWMADHSSAAEEWMATHHSSGYDEQQYGSSSYQPQGVSLTFNSNQLLSSRELLTQNTKEAQMLMLLLQHPEVLGKDNSLIYCYVECSIWTRLVLCGCLYLTGICLLGFIDFILSFGWVLFHFILSCVGFYCCSD